MRSLRAILNEGNLNKLADALRALRGGNAMGLLPQFRVDTDVDAAPADVAVLPETAKAARVLDAYVRAGTVTGRFTPVNDSTPATTQVGVNATGDIVFQATDAVEEAELTYVPVEGPVIEEVVDVVANIGTPLNNRLAHVLLEAEALVGTATGDATVVDRGTTPAAGQAALTDGGTVEFAAADAVTQARIRYIAQPGVGEGVTGPVGTELDVEDKGF